MTLALTLTQETALRVCVVHKATSFFDHASTMVVRIRLARHGTRNNPFHHIVVINQRVARNAKPIELVGVFDPIPRAPEKPFPKYPFQNDGTLLKNSILPEVEKVKRIEWSVERIKYWISVGAQPSKAVMRLLDMVCTILLSRHLILLSVCLTQGGIAVPFRRSPKPGPLSQGNLLKKTEEKADDFKPPIVGFKRPPDAVIAEEVSSVTPLNTASNVFPSTVS